MDGDEAVVEQEMTPELDAAADAEFEAAFNTKRNNLLGVEGTTTEAAAAAAPKAEEVIDEQDSTQPAAEPAAADAEAQVQAQAEAPAAAAAAPVAPAVTKEAMDAIAAQVSALHEELKQTRDKHAGSIGSLKQTLDAVKAQAQKGIRPTVKQLARLEGEFPELAALLTQDLADAFGEPDAPATAAAAEETPAPAVEEEASGAAAPGAEPVDPMADPRVVKVLKQKEMDIVTLKHPDWRQITKTAEFDEWKNSLPAAAKNLLDSTWDSTTLSAAFTDFKGWKEKRVAAANALKERGKNLEHAIQPTSGQPTGKSVQDDDAAFVEGFNQARGNR